MSQPVPGGWNVSTQPSASDVHHAPSPARWLNSILEETGRSRAQAGRMLGRSRELVTRWANGREKIPRRVLRELAQQLAPNDEQYVALLADLADERRHLAGEAEEFSRRHSLNAAQIQRKILDEAMTRSSRAITRDAEVADFLGIASAGSFALRAISDYLAGEQDSLIHQNNLQRHLRFPSNLAVGVFLQDDPSPGSRVIREMLLADLRRSVESIPTTPASSLVRHHSLHMLGRYGDARDRSIVQYEMDEGRYKVDPLVRKLGYCGLMMNPERGPEIADQFLYYLGRDKGLAEVDLAFDATHFGDIALDAHNDLRRPTGELPRLAENIARHFLEPSRYGQIAEADTHRLIHILELGGGNAFRGRTAVMLQACLEADLLPTAAHEGRLLKRGLEATLRRGVVSRGIVVQVSQGLAVEGHDISERFGRRHISVGSAASNTYQHVTFLTAIMPGGTMNTGDTFDNRNSQIAAQGSKSRAENVRLLQSNSVTVDLGPLVEELRVVLERMQSSAQSPEEYRSVADVAEAIQAAEDNDRIGLTDRLRAAGRYALETAKEIGSSVAAEAIKKSMGL